MTTKDINILIDRYLAGETTPEEERQLALEVAREDAPTEWRAIAEMLGDLTLGEAMYDDIMQKRKEARERRRRMWMSWSVASCVAVVMVVGAFLFCGNSGNDALPLVAQADSENDVSQVDSVSADTVAGKTDVQEKPVDTDDASMMIKGIHRITNARRLYIAQAEEADDVREAVAGEYGDDYAEVDEPVMVLDMDLEEFRSCMANLNEAVAVVRDDFDNE